jgi:very-short-patch-repair endonuclease
MPAVPSHEFAVTRDIDGKPRTRPSEREIAGLARRQHGVVTRPQLLELGLGEAAIDSRLANGRLRKLHSGVYTLGHGLVSREGLWLAATFRVGRSAVLSHGSAAALWGIRRAPENGGIQVSAPHRTHPPKGIQRHYMRLATDEMTARRRIPVTTLARTLFDLASETSIEGLEGAIREAEYLHRFPLEALEKLRCRHRGQRGTRTIESCLSRLDFAPRGRTRSELEGRFRSLLARTDLPTPELNALLDLDGYKVEADCLWRNQRVIAELDGGRAHRTRVAFETDRERDRRLLVAGWRVIRITWRQLARSASLQADLRHLLRT